jgi:hypothetical protein
MRPKEMVRLEWSLSRTLRKRTIRSIEAFSLIAFRSGFLLKNGVVLLKEW